MTTDLQELKTTFQSKLLEAKNLLGLEAVEREFFSRKHGVMTMKMKELSHLSDDERKVRGSALNVVKEELMNALEKRRLEFSRKCIDDLATKDLFDITMDLPQAERGHLHLIPEFIRQVEEVFGRMGFDVAYGPEVEDEEMNFDLLNIPPDHPARDLQATFWIKSKGEGEKRCVLRTHTSSVQIRYMRDKKPPFRMICPGVVYRKDADATHSPMFYQCEGLMIGKDVSLAHMKGVMVAAIRELISPDVTFRFRASYYPFVEPGLDLDMRWQGDLAKSREGEWLEVAGCGMVHPNVLRNVGINPDHWQGFAFGFGIDRLLMIKHQIPNIRLFYQGDLRFLRQF